MYFPPESIRLLRYLCVWRVNASLARVPHHFRQVLPLVLGQLIAEHLPTRVAGQWNKQLAAWEQYQKHRARSDRSGHSAPLMPETLWPMDAVFFPYPGKNTYGRGELIFWELKLIGGSADHTFFMEVILPAMEEAGYTRDKRWNQHNSLWGRFDIDSIYVAHGDRWEPLAQEGSLDLRYRPDPLQWLEGRSLPDPAAENLPGYNELTWLTPFDFATPAEAFITLPSHHYDEDEYPTEIEEEAPTPESEYTEYYAQPFMRILLHALLERLEHIAGTQHKGPVNIWNLLNEEQENHLRAALAAADSVQLNRHTLERSPRNASGRVWGHQEFTPIPPALWPYLDLASILHVGQYTQFGCGSFTVV